MLTNILTILIVVMIVIVAGSITMLLWTIADKLLDLLCGYTMTEALIDFFDMIIGKT